MPHHSMAEVMRSAAELLGAVHALAKLGTAAATERAVATAAAAAAAAAVAAACAGEISFESRS